MALRIAVNKELDGLENFFDSVHLQLEPGSRVVVISFHSLEDRIIKWAFRKMQKKSGKIINKKVIVASEAEVLTNPRSRSAKMRNFRNGRSSVNELYSTTESLAPFFFEFSFLFLFLSSMFL